MNAADRLFMAGYAAALDAAEQAGVRLLQSAWGNTIRREHAGGALVHFANSAREAIAAEGVLVTRMPSQSPTGLRQNGDGHAVTVTADATVFAGAPRADTRQTAAPRLGASGDARLLEYAGEACPDCANFTLVQNGTCLKCDTCGSTTGCS